MRTPSRASLALAALSLLAGCAGAQRTEAERPRAAAPDLAAARVGLQAAVLVERRLPGGARIDVLADGEALENGDGLRLALELARPAHVLAIYLDSRARASLLFPSPDLPLQNPLPAGKSLDIPLAGSWFTLEGEPGQESIYLLASPEPLADVPGLLARLSALGPGWATARADQTVAEHLTRGGVLRPHEVPDPARASGQGGQGLARPDERHGGGPAEPPRSPPADDPDRQAPFRRPMLLAGVVRGDDSGSELRRLLENDGVEVRTVSFQHR
ncbi:MAG TPA: DUF4384 domain-containing protein [Myxococcota bacterium]|nr:DUF4384 domain-containing protein [Myxococcota bacterium]HRY94978.1 DUF4384 domain-containing protein [Myxococcota bacterium]HSA20969.1 DUF4384 domain-containing protein [Myxococcota bacterium]